MAQNHSPLMFPLPPNFIAAQGFRLGGVVGGHRVSGRDNQNQFQRQYPGPSFVTLQRDDNSVVAALGH